MWWGEEGGFKIIVKGQIMITTINPGNPYREQQAVDAPQSTSPPSLGRWLFRQLSTV